MKLALGSKNILGIVQLFGYECMGADKPQVLQTVQKALLWEAAEKGLVDNSSTLARNIGVDVSSATDPTQSKSFLFIQISRMW